MTDSTLYMLILLTYCPINFGLFGLLSLLLHDRFDSKVESVEKWDGALTV